MSHILIVEDEPSLQETLAYNLEKHGHTVHTENNGRTALDYVRQTAPDLILLDLMLPGMDGVELCKTLRAEGLRAPILMLTARDDEIDRILGLEIGADDYITKPFSMRELMARVKAHLRRNDINIAEAPAISDLQINQTRREVTLHGKILHMKPKEYELLAFFSEHRGQMLSREFILQRVWGWDYIGDSRTVDVHVRWLRQKIESDPANPTRLVTVRGGGYRFEG
jgi:DNA-binding response OmpR family regulator